MKISQHLREAKARIDNPEKWTVLALARTKDNIITDTIGVSACKFCSLGACNRQLYEAGNDEPIYHHLVQYLREAAVLISEDPDMTISRFNDTHTHDQVMAMWDKAIQLAEKDEANG